LTYLIALVAGVVTSMVLTPLMTRLAPACGLMDQPDPRKVHSVPIPRVGGIGIVIGALIPIFVLIPSSELVQAYLLGSLVLFGFGVWDDHSSIGHYAKFVGQILAVGILVFYGGLTVHSFPLLGDAVVPDFIAIPFTMFAMIGVINAINHSDGLDGLAGGESFISFSAIALLAYLAGSEYFLVITLAVMGGLLGFLRYNTHPAQIFMGDSGSQFLGYTLGFLVISLVEEIDPDLSPAVTLLLIGLPIVDIIVVMGKRIRGGKNWFRATRNHLHHRLIDLGFVHQQSVVIIYSVQFFLVVSAILLRHKNDAFSLGLYLLVCIVLFGSISRAEAKGWKAKQHDQSANVTLVTSKKYLHRAIVTAPRRFLSIAIPFYFLGTSLSVEEIPRDFASMSALLFVLLVIETLVGREPRSIMRRALIYITAIFVVYLRINYPPAWWIWVQPLDSLLFVLIAISFVLAVKYSPRRRRVEFDTTAMDYLLMLLLLAGLIASGSNLIGNTVIAFVVEVAVLFYACELLITEKRERWNAVSIASLVALLVFAVRGLLLSTYPELSII
jgi:UDP-GlcNAc:undecaprenyl-phosphate GlcNAc-1-phosphate transferase